MVISKFATAALAGASFFAMHAAHAQSTSAPAADQAGGPQAEVADIVVTAERRSSSLQRTANSISVRSGEDLQASGKYQLSQILEDVPGIAGGATSQAGNTTGSGSDTPSAGLIIRGIASNVPVGGSNNSVAPAAAVYVDGVYSGIGGSYDIGRVEILRGPQGTLYGRSATSGLVAIHTANPKMNEFGGDIQGEVGNYDMTRLSGAVNIPLVDDVLALRVAGNRYERDGYWSRDGGYQRSTSGRIKLLFTPTTNFTLLLGASLEDNIVNSGGVTISQISAGAPNKYAFVPVTVGSEQYVVNHGTNKSHQFFATANWDTGLGEFTYEGAYRHYEQALPSVATFGPTIVAGNTDTPRSNFLTQELRLASHTGTPLTWQLGLFYYRNKLVAESDNSVVNSDGSLTFKNRSVIPGKKTNAIGVFGEATYAFTPTTRVTGGLRYDYTKVDTAQTFTTPIASNSIDASASFNNITYKARIEHDLSPRNLIYAATATGFSPGDIALGVGNDDSIVQMDYGAKTLYSYEIGTKNRFLDNKLTVNASAFYIYYQGYQKGDFDFALGQGLPFSVLAIIPMRSMGLEFETAYKLTDHDNVFFNLALTRARYMHRDSLSYATSPTTSVGLSQLQAYDRVPNVAPVFADIAYDHRFDLSGGSSLTVRGDVRYIGAYLGGPIRPDQVAADQYDYVRSGDALIGNLNVRWTSSDSRYSVSAYVRNVGDRRYKTAVNMYGAGASSGDNVSLGDPRTYGLVLNASF